METKPLYAATSHAKVYSYYRRDIPVSLIEKVISCLKRKYDGPLHLAVDVGCGSGQSTVCLAPFFKKIHGIDVSEAQIQEAKTNRPLYNVTYQVASAEIIPFDDGSVQLISASASLHWFQLDTFFSEVRRVLCNNGVLVVYCYTALKPLLENPALTKEIDELWNEIHSMSAKCAPQVNIAFDFYKSVSFPFEEIMKCYLTFLNVNEVFDDLNEILQYANSSFSDSFIECFFSGVFNRFDDVRDIFDGELQDILGFFSSFSGYQNWKREEEKKASEFLIYIEKRFREIIIASNLDPDKPLKLYRDFFLIICRKIEKGN